MTNALQTHSNAAVVSVSRDVMKQHARSFSWAAFFLPRDRHDDAAVVYAFCRLVDDLVDEAPDIPTGAAAIEKLIAELHGHDDPRELVAAYREVATRSGIADDAAEHLAEGVQSDAGEVLLQSDRDLIRYCYRVAGVVGVMMCGVLGVQDPRALPHAIDLGIGMQLTNICRDVLEDAERGRVYLPEERLRAIGVSHAELLDAARRDELDIRHVVRDLLALAERYYLSAEAGMRFIPARSRAAILAASRIYRAIGQRLLRKGANPLSGRTIVPWTGRLTRALGALGAFLKPKTLGLTAYRGHDASLHMHLSGFPGANLPPEALDAARLRLVA